MGTGCEPAGPQWRSHPSCSSQHPGVSWHKRSQKWEARIQFDGVKYTLGRFVKETDAAAAYQKRRQELEAGRGGVNVDTRGSKSTGATKGRALATAEPRVGDKVLVRFENEPLLCASNGIHVRDNNKKWKTWVKAQLAPDTAESGAQQVWGASISQPAPS